MNIGFIAAGSRKDLIENFCVAYKSILARHEQFLSGSVGGEKQFIDMIQRDYMDLVIYFYNPLMSSPNEPDIIEITRECDRYNIPIATNIATAEAMVLGLEQGSFQWRAAVREGN